MGEIVRLDENYLDQLAKIDSESGHEMGKARRVTLQKYKTELIERFNRGHELFFGYKENGLLKGYVTLIPFFPGHKHCEVYWLSVRKTFQGKGIGTALMTFIEDYARKLGLRKVCLYTNKEMDGVRKFYEKLGYVLINEFSDYYGYTDVLKNTAVLYAKVL
ncbi:MAG: GNAT family N-acetyltransferase [Nanoarchaeota archaeon]|nr:GNAT family N-acetyltransferase [Nanoarchaeota archaeon]MBU4300056.1 GNAT family N-acetyltransferase [Nanoarchaeota archaeon]MBU4451857.1 GNAT family N-acetyltransferase [Nanoarchaeota archaeon]MCG2724407.1 GNAT family N-acetyltransferase [archaeon]